MVLVTLRLALSGILGLAVGGTRCREDQAPLIHAQDVNRTAPSPFAGDARRSYTLHSS